MFRKTLLTAFFATMFLGSAEAEGPVPSSGEIVLGEWNSDLAAAKTAANDRGVPLLVLWESPTCGHCKAFNLQLAKQEFIDYLANRGLVMVYGVGTSSAATKAIKSWVGSGNYPLWRVTWSKGGVNYKGQYPKTYAGFRAELESQISGYVAGSTDTPQDEYDPNSDAASTAPTLVWNDQVVTKSLRLSKNTDYTDLADWYKLAVEQGKTYKVWFSNVSGQSEDTVKAAVYGDAAGSVVVQSAVNLASADFEFVPVADGVVYVKVWRTTSHDAAITYSMSYKRQAPGQIEFANAAVSAAESDKNVVLTLKRTGGTTGQAKVTISTVGKSGSNAFTATAGEDFDALPSPTTLSWADGDSSSKTVTVTLEKSSTEWEGAETFGVKLTPDLVTLPGMTVGPDAVVTLQEVDGLVTAAANYQGWVGALDDEGVMGTVSLSVNAAGGLSGKAVFPKVGTPYSGTYTLKNAAYQAISNGTAWVAGSFSQSGSTLPVVFQISIESGRVVGELGTDSTPIELYRDDWGKSAWAKVAKNFSGYYTVAFPNCCSRWPDDAPGGSGFATITLDQKGRYKVAGKLGDGTVLTQSGVLFLHPETTVTNPVLCALLYSAPTTYKGGVFGGVICFGDQNTNGVIDVSMGYGESLVWRSLDPFSVPSYDETNPGFESTLSAIGGWYNKTENLKTYYEGKSLFVGDLEEPPELSYTQTTLDSDGTTRSDETTPAASWQSVTNYLPISIKANGSGFTVPTADLRLLGADDEGVPLYNYDTAVNPNALNVAFNRTTGVISGSFKVYYDYVVKDDARGDPEKLTWQHTQKVATYASVLMLEQQSDDYSDLVADGYYLFADSATYETATGAERSYSLKRSYDFAIRSDVSE